MYEDFEFNCRLFIHSEKDIQELRKSLSDALCGAVVGSSIETDCMHVKLSKWDGFDNKKIRDYKGFLCYRYSAEVDAIHEIYGDKPQASPEEFCEQLCGLIKYLRENGELVVVASDFDELVVEKTGWNWSESTPEHP